MTTTAPATTPARKPARTKKIEVSRSYLLHLQARASMVEHVMRTGDPVGRLRDDAHDLILTIESLLEDNGMELLTKEQEIEVAFGKSHCGLL